MADENEEVRPCDLTETREEFYDDDVVVVDSKLHNTAKMPAKSLRFTHFSSALHFSLPPPSP